MGYLGWCIAIIATVCIVAPKIIKSDICGCKTDMVTPKSYGCCPQTAQNADCPCWQPPRPQGLDDKLTYCLGQVMPAKRASLEIVIDIMAYLTKLPYMLPKDYFMQLFGAMGGNPNNPNQFPSIVGRHFGSFVTQLSAGIPCDNVYVVLLGNLGPNQTTFYIRAGATDNVYGIPTKMPPVWPGTLNCSASIHNTLMAMPLDELGTMVMNAIEDRALCRVPNHPTQREATNTLAPTVFSIVITDADTGADLSAYMKPTSNAVIVDISTDFGYQNDNYTVPNVIQAFSPRDLYSHVRTLRYRACQAVCAKPRPRF